MSGDAGTPRASGRTRAQGGGSAVLEDRVLYVTPQGLERIRRVMATCAGVTPLERGAAACTAAGLISLDVGGFVAAGLPLLDVRVDLDLVQTPEYSESERRRPAPARGAYVQVPKKRDYTERNRRARERAAQQRAAASQVALPSEGSES